MVQEIGKGGEGGEGREGEGKTINSGSNLGDTGLCETLDKGGWFGARLSRFRVSQLMQLGEAAVEQCQAERQTCLPLEARLNGQEPG